MSDLDLDHAPVAPAGSLGGVPLIDLAGPALDVAELQIAEWRIAAT